MGKDLKVYAESPAFEVQKKVVITEKDVADTICTMFEGGSNYWIEGISYPKGFIAEAGSYRSENIADVVLAGNSVIIKDNEDGETWYLNIIRLKKGFELYYNEYRNATDIDNFDAEHADVLLQYSLFGKIVFG